MNNFLRNILCLVICFGFNISCDNNFEEINTDPNRLEAVTPGSLLAPVLLYSNNAILNRTHRISHELMQYTVQINLTNEFHRYVFPATETDYLWRNLYRWASNANEMYDLAESIDDTNNMAIALIIKSWIMAQVTDIFGDVPYSQAFEGAELVYFPEFDNQQTIYQNMLDNLKKANDIIDISSNLNPTSDPLYDGDMLKWKKFCNSLRLRFLIRISGRPEMNSEGEINEIFSNPVKYPLISSNDESAIFKYTGVSPFVNPLYEFREFDFSGNRAYGSTFINILNNAEDPRREKFATTSITNEFVGIESGESSGVTTQQTDNEGKGVSRYLPSLQSADHPTFMLTYSETLFNLAEAAQKGWIAGDAASYYLNAVKASVEQWGATASSSFLENPSIAYNGTQEQLMEQKYVALFFVGFEAWSEYRRTGLPEMPIGSATQNDHILPTRLEYPVIAKSTNEENTNKASENMGGDTMKVKVWWDVE